MELNSKYKTTTSAIMDGATISISNTLENSIKENKNNIEENKKTLSKHHVELEEIKSTVRDSVLLFQAKVGMISSKHETALVIIKKYCKIIVTLEIIDIAVDVIKYFM